MPGEIDRKLDGFLQTLQGQFHDWLDQIKQVISDSRSGLSNDVLAALKEMAAKQDVEIEPVKGIVREARTLYICPNPASLYVKGADGVLAAIEVKHREYALFRCIVDLLQMAQVADLLPSQKTATQSLHWAMGFVIWYRWDLKQTAPMKILSSSCALLRRAMKTAWGPSPFLGMGQRGGEPSGTVPIEAVWTDFATEETPEEIDTSGRRTTVYPINDIFQNHRLAWEAVWKADWTEALARATNVLTIDPTNWMANSLVILCVQALAWGPGALVFTPDQRPIIKAAFECALLKLRIHEAAWLEIDKYAPPLHQEAALKAYGDAIEMIEERTDALRAIENWLDANVRIRDDLGIKTPTLPGDGEVPWVPLDKLAQWTSSSADEETTKRIEGLLIRVCGKCREYDKNEVQSLFHAFVRDSIEKGKVPRTRLGFKWAALAYIDVGLLDVPGNDENERRANAGDLRRLRGAVARSPWRFRDVLDDSFDTEKLTWLRTTLGWSKDHLTKVLEIARVVYMSQTDRDDQN